MKKYKVCNISNNEIKAFYTDKLKIVKFIIKNPVYWVEKLNKNSGEYEIENE